MEKIHPSRDKILQLCVGSGIDTKGFVTGGSHPCGCWQLLPGEEMAPRWCSGKEYACRCRRPRRWRFSPWVGKIPWRRKWQPTPVSLWKIHRQRSLAGYSPWSHKQLDMTEHTHTYMHTHTYT